MKKEMKYLLKKQLKNKMYRLALPVHQVAPKQKPLC